MSTQLAKQTRTTEAMAIEAALIGGDLKELNPQGRIDYYNALCNSLGLNPLSKPFAYITLNGKLTLYALRDAADQLRKLNGVSITEMIPEHISDLFVVRVKATDREGRTDGATGAVNIKGLTGEALANAMMKAETKAKRRVTLSLCGLGFLDETEVETLKDQGIAKETLFTVDSRGNEKPLAEVIAEKIVPAKTETPKTGKQDELVFIDTITYHETKPSQTRPGGSKYAIIRGLHEGELYYVWDTTFFVAAEANKGRTLTLGVKTDAKGRKSIVSGLEPLPGDDFASQLEASLEIGDEDVPF